MENKIEKITLGAGCFWCVEAIFDKIKGVVSVKSGYMGGSTENPTYEQVCTGETKHAEVVQITYDANEVNITDILSVFWEVHDPTSLNRQGEDIGTQYRSAIFYSTEQQKMIAEEQIKIIDAEKLYDNPIVTEVMAASVFYPAEDYHNNYFALNGDKPYCKMVIRPKIDKFKKLFMDRLK